MLLILDQRMHILAASDRWLRHFRYTSEEVVQRSLADFLVQEDRDRATQAGLQEFECTWRCEGIEYRMLTGQQTQIDLALSAEVLARDDPAQTRIHVVFQDITERKLAESVWRREQARQLSILEGTEAGTWEWNVQTDEARVDARLASLLGYPPDHFANLTGEGALALMDDEDRASARRFRDRYVAGLEPRYELVVRRRHRDGSWLWILNRGEVRSRLADGTPEWLMGTYLDITPLKAREAALKETRQDLELANQQLQGQKELLRVTLESIRDGVITTDHGGLINWLNPVAESLTGWSGADAVGLPLGDVFRVSDGVSGAALPCALPQWGMPDAAPSPQYEGVLRARDGRLIAIEESLAPILGPRGAVLGGVLVFRDVSERRRLGEEMQYRATHDALTGLLNRAEFEQRLARCMQGAQADGSQHVLLFIDLDQFKLVNDSCGLTVGDELLKQVARLFREGVRARDALARLGGDEFAVLLEHCSIDQAHRLATQICEQMDNFRFVHGQQRFRLGASIGLVPVDQRWGVLTELVQAGDACCHAAKEQGRNRVHVWVDSDAVLLSRRAETQWAARIAAALDDDQFVLHVQPIAWLRGPAAGHHAEVLLRMIAPDGQLIAPGAFLPAAERFHLASRIDRWVFGQVLTRLAALPDRLGLDLLCINLSGRSVSDRNFHLHVLEALDRSPADLRACLCFEITETAAITNLTDAAAFIRQVRALGVRIALDDFGAGPSSFAYLKTLTVDLLKIDGGLVQGVVTDALDETAVRSFVEVARVVGLKTIAEAVESPAVLQRLRALGVDAAQGYLLHQPVPLDTWLAGLSATPSP